jgi:hypothetical protein
VLAVLFGIGIAVVLGFWFHTGGSRKRLHPPSQRQAAHESTFEMPDASPLGWAGRPQVFGLSPARRGPRRPSRRPPGRRGWPPRSQA